MVFLIFDLEQDKILGFINPQNISYFQKKVFSITYLIHCLIFITLFFFFKIDLDEQQINTLLLMDIGFILFMGLLFMVLIKKISSSNIYTQVAPLPETQDPIKRFSTNSQSQVIQITRIPSLWNFLKYILIFSSILAFHGTILLIQISSQIKINSLIPHHILFYYALSSIMINLFVLISVSNLLLCLICSKNTLIDFTQNNNIDRISSAFWNFQLNFFELFCLSSNLSFLLSSFIGVTIIGDTLSWTIVYSYLTLTFIWLIHLLSNIIYKQKSVK